jgi:hypothetical protein
MDVSIWVESWRESIKSGMRREPVMKKLCILMGGFITFICALILGSF